MNPRCTVKGAVLAAVVVAILAAGCGGVLDPPAGSGGVDHPGDANPFVPEQGGLRIWLGDGQTVSQSSGSRAIRKSGHEAETVALRLGMATMSDSVFLSHSSESQIETMRVSRHADPWTPTPEPLPEPWGHDSYVTMVRFGHDGGGEDIYLHGSDLAGFAINEMVVVIPQLVDFPEFIECDQFGCVTDGRNYTVLSVPHFVVGSDLYTDAMISDEWWDGSSPERTWQRNLRVNGHEYAFVDFRFVFYVPASVFGEGFSHLVHTNSGFFEHGWNQGGWQPTIVYPDDHPDAESWILDPLNAATHAMIQSAYARQGRSSDGSLESYFYDYVTKFSVPPGGNEFAGAIYWYTEAQGGVFEGTHYRFSGYQIIAIDEIVVPPGGAAVVQVSYDPSSAQFDTSDGVLSITAESALDFRTSVTVVEY